MTAVAITIWLHLLGPTPSGCVPPAVVETAPLPSTVPTLAVPETWRPREVIPPKKKKRD